MLPLKPRDGSPHLIAVVDDDQAVLNSLKFSLEIEGYAVLACSSGETLLAAPALTNAACLVVDHVMPELDGMALIGDLRRRGIQVPVILITSNPPAELQRRARVAGLVIVEKPLLGNALMDALRRALHESAPASPQSDGAGESTATLPRPPR